MGEQRQLLDQMLARADVCVQELHGRLEESTGSEEASLVGLEVTVFEAMMRLGAGLLGLILSTYAAGLLEASPTRRPCECGGVRRWVSARTKTVLSLLGQVTYARVSFQCARCKQGEALGDRRWGLEHTRTTAGVVHLLG